MVKYKVLCTVDLKLAPDALEPLHEIAETCCMVPRRAAVLEAIGEFDACIVGADLLFDKEMIGRAGKLKVLATPSTGTDHIDKEALAARNIKLLAITTEYELLDSFTATAECAWGLLISCIRRISAGFDELKRGRWAREVFTGTQLSGKTLGVIGVGRLGRMVVEYGKAFRMRVLGCDIKDLNIPGVEQVSFETLLAESDVISLHVHLNNETRGMISKEAFEKMKSGVVLVNTSRGGLIDEAAFLEALESGKVAAAGLDVIDGEWMDDISSHPLVRYAKAHDNLVITPHVGGATVESIVGARVFIAQKLADYLADMKE